MTDRTEQLKKLLEADPTDAFCMYGLALEYAKVDDHASAIEWFDRSLEVDPGFCYAYFHKARVQNDAGDVGGAFATLEVGLQHAQRAGDLKAASEIQGLMDEIEP